MVKDKECDHESSIYCRDFEYAETISKFSKKTE